MPTARYRHTLVYRINGVHLGTEEEAELIADSTSGFRAILTTDPDPYCIEADRYTAISFLMLNAVFGPSEASTYDERLKSTLAEIRETRINKFGNGPYLVLTKEATMEEVSPPSNTKETQDFVIWLDGAQKEPLRQASEAQIRAALTALMLAAEDTSGIETVSDTVIFFRKDGKPIYSYTSRLTGNLSVLRALPTAAIDSVSGWYKTIARDQELERVTRLLVSSLQTEGDKLRSFLAAYTAMEIFINKTFKRTYEEQFFRELTVGDYADARRFLEGVRRVMNDRDKYTIVDKLALISSRLCPENADEDVRQLSQAKRYRDNLVHGENIDEAGLPVRTVQNLARRYLRLHLVS